MYVTVIKDFTKKEDGPYIHLIKTTDTDVALDLLNEQLKDIEEPLIKHEINGTHPTIKIYKVVNETSKGWLYNTNKTKEILIYKISVTNMHIPIKIKTSKVSNLRDDFINELKSKVKDRFPLERDLCVISE